ncbi:hypothetical protein G6F49_007578 [Rhizopus delemar]|nr:hypothetical protein G6F49_007578 [Rhizopus delemar]
MHGESASVDISSENIQNELRKIKELLGPYDPVVVFMLVTSAEDTVTAYSQAVSQTIQANVQQFSSPISSTSSSIKSCSATSSSSSSVQKRARYTIHDFLADNESYIMAFGKLDKYIVNYTDVVLEFKKFQRYSIEYIKSVNYFDQNYDIHRMLAFSNIILIDKTTNPRLLPDIVPKETYRLMTQDFIQNHMLSIKFNEKLYKRVKNMLEKYFAYETNDESDEDIREKNNESRIKLLKLARKANKYEKSAIEVIVSLITSLTNNKLNRVSELHLSSSYIHTMISSTFGSSNVIPHCSNLLPHEQTETKSKERQDYVCDKYKNHEYDYSTLYGEIKTNENTNNAFENRCKTGHLPEPAYDYFSFAELCDQSKAVTNLYYSTLMNNLIKEHPTNQEAISALNIFNKRRNNDSLRLEKRRMETVLQLNDDPCAEIEAISKKHRRNVPNENQEVAFKEIIKVTQNISNEATTEDAVNSLTQSFADIQIKKTRVSEFIKDECNLSIKVISKHPTARNSPAVIEKRAVWVKEWLEKRMIYLQNCVFLDESGFDINMTRERAWSTREEPAVVETPSGRATSHTVLGAISSVGVAPGDKLSMPNGTTGAHYMHFITDTMNIMYTFPDMQGFHIVMDNAPIHVPIYLPPYSPELNPIEVFWSIVKSKVKRHALKDTETLTSRIIESCEEVSLQHLQNCIQHSELESRIKEVQSKIEQNTHLKKKAIELRKILKDRNAQLQCDTQIRECQRYIDYFTEELRRLRIRGSRASFNSSYFSDSAPLSEGSTILLQQPLTSSPIQSLDSPSVSALGEVVLEEEKNEEEEEDSCKRYTNLDLLEADTPINRAKVSLKLHELEYKVDVEKKVQEGIRNLYQLLDKTVSTADRRRKTELHEKQLECQEKMALLNNAVKKYKDLYLGEDEEVIEPFESRTVGLLPGARKPVTGKLQLKIVEAHELAHAPTRLFRDPQTAVMVKIDGNIQFRTRPSKNDKWTDSFEMYVDKATEVELLVYDQSGDRTLPIGLLWLKISDITESLRKRKLEAEQADPNWVPAEIAQKHDDTESVIQQKNNISKSKNVSDSNILAWFDVEPIGRILLEINFVRENVKRRPMDKLGRAGAVRERKGEVHEMNGHQFVDRRFYHIMKCALCGDFMAKLTYQCEDCGLACHKKCYSHVVTRCKSRSTSRLDRDEDELKHHIPHRFESLTIILGANWCCHCGFMLPLGFRGAQKCIECGVVCHTKCTSLVPDFCGMTMEQANLMLSEVKAANNRRRTFHSEELHQSASDNHQKPLFSSPFFNTQASQQTSENISLQPSLSTPVIHKLNALSTRPSSLVYDSNSFQHISHLFGSQNTISEKSSMHFTTPVQVNRKVGLDDFNLLAVLGKGNFGKVMLAEEKYTSELYAIKILKKRFVLDNDEVESTRSEKRIFLTANEERHPFLVNLHSTFQTETRIYYVMEYVSGGDLMLHIQREQFSEARAKFYACEVLLALEYFHKHGIIYRDLKLDNIMLCLDGHIKLADYGLCKENMWGNNTTNTFCGTPEFMAPEILLENRYGRAVDWWAFGVLLYEMLLGQSPFKGEDEDEIFDAVLEDNILYPINLSKNSVAICEALLERNPQRRLGGGKGDAQEVKNHLFFTGVNWEDMLAKRVPPPFLPTVSGRADTSNFDEEFTREIPILTPVNAMLTSEEQQNFANFSYVANWAVEK